MDTMKHARSHFLVIFLWIWITIQSVAAFVPLFVQPTITTRSRARSTRNQKHAEAVIRASFGPQSIYASLQPDLFARQTLRLQLLTDALKDSPETGFARAYACFILTPTVFFRGAFLGAVGSSFWRHRLQEATDGMRSLERVPLARHEHPPS